ncbi:MAG: penicillin-binding protein 2 [Bacteroidia bacterium]|nr:penicillin-binding protein 2 [Bacteroidia bacterium]
MENLERRGTIIIIFIALVFGTFIIRLFTIQVLNEEYSSQAENYVIRHKQITPPRGNIYNRHGEIFVSNRPMFSMLITPEELMIRDTTFLSRQLGIPVPELIEMIRTRRINQAAAKQEAVFARYIEPENYGALQEQLWDSRGITFSASLKRYYRYPIGANILGYISEVSPSEIKSNPDKYHSGDLIGKAGIERSYDTILRGVPGVRQVLKNVNGREVGSHANGKYDQPAIKGTDIMLGIDTDLQRFGEELMRNKKGSIVAIEPATGEILAFVSAPTYDPAKLTGKDYYQNWPLLKKDSLNPLYNRPLMARYPPGSIFKLAVALAALNEGTLTPETFYGCGGGFKRNKGKPGCRFHPSPLQLEGAIQYSCNSYFAATYMDFLHHDKFPDFYTGYNTWYKYMSLLGVGTKLNVDVPYEVSGLLPAAQRYDKIYGVDNWKATTIISNAIGQGEILMTPLQMANMVAIIANRGKYLPPHFVRAKRPDGAIEWIRTSYDTTYTGIRREHFEVVIDAMEKVVSQGTARRAFIEEISICGKTGTVENPHGEDHAVFIGFAPRDNPRIAVAVVIENAGGGGSWAAPTASLMIEQYLRGTITAKQAEYERISQASFIRNSYARKR